MSKKEITTNFECSNIAPLTSLVADISSSSLKFAIHADNGSGKTFLSRLFRLASNSNKALQIDEFGDSPTDNFLTFGATQGYFKFQISCNAKDLELLDIKLEQGKIPIINKTNNYIYHTFNQDYVDENVRQVHYEKNSSIEGYILGKTNIDIRTEETQLKTILDEGENLSETVKNSINDYVQKNIDSVQNIKRLAEYKSLNYETLERDYLNPRSIEDVKNLKTSIDDYNKIKSIPEGLNSISLLSKPVIQIGDFESINDTCSTEHSVSSLQSSFKEKVKQKQGFIEKGVQILEDNKTQCPFCEQNLAEKALILIELYVEYINDSESKIINSLKNLSKIISTYKPRLKDCIGENLIRKNKFDEYKEKYIPTCNKISLEDIEVTACINAIDKIINKIDEKIQNIKKIIILDNLVEEVKNNIKNINDIIDRNNKKIQDINSKIENIGIEGREVRRTICKSAYNELLEKYTPDIKRIVEYRKNYKTLRDEIEEKKNKVKVAKKDKVAETIKAVLNYFFADKYTFDSETFLLKFKNILLNKNKVKHVLSEGEKNIIAFAFFLGDTHIQIEKEDDYEKLFFIIDDPISSMDFSHVYTLSGIIRRLEDLIPLGERKRFIILTHNNDFMRILCSNNIASEKLKLKKNKIMYLKNTHRMLYIDHLFDIYRIAQNSESPTHTTANSIRHIIETLIKLENLDISKEGVDKYIQEHFDQDRKTYTLINDLSHGGLRSEQLPILDDDYIDICKDIISHIKINHKGHYEYCQKVCQ